MKGKSDEQLEKNSIEIKFESININIIIYF